MKIIGSFGRPLPVLETIVGGLPLVDLPSGSADEYVVEISPSPTFNMAVGHFPDSSPVVLPREVMETWTGDCLFMRVVRRRNSEVLASYAVETRDDESGSSRHAGEV